MIASTEEKAQVLLRDMMKDCETLRDQAKAFESFEGNQLAYSDLTEIVGLNNMSNRPSTTTTWSHRSHRSCSPSSLTTTIKQPMPLLSLCKLSFELFSQVVNIFVGIIVQCFSSKDGEVLKNLAQHEPGDMVRHEIAMEQSIVPFQCSLAEASETLDRLACTHEAVSAAVSGDEIATAVLGMFCVFSAAAATSSAFIVVGTKTWTAASSIIAYIRRVQAELIRDPVDFGYWQLRSLAWRAEEVVDGEDTSRNAMPPRLIEGRDWDDEESESWEEDDVRSEKACDSPSAIAEPAVASGGGASAADVTRLGEWPPAAEPRHGMGATTGDALGIEIGATSSVTAGPASDDWGDPFFKANFNESPSVLGAHAAPESSMIDRRKSPLIDLHATPPSAPAQPPSGAVSSFTKIGRGNAPSIDLLTTPVTPSSAAVIPAAAPVHGPSPIVHALGAQFVATAPLVTLVAMEHHEPGVIDDTAEVSNAGTSLAEGLAGGKVQNNETRSDAREHVRGASQTATPASGVKKLLAAVIEDLAYVHRGSTLQTYAITGSVLVTTSEDRVIMRLTDRQGHIAKATANPAVASETSSALPTREYSCNTRSSQAMGAPRPKYLQAVTYSCSAVKQLPVRVTSRLRAVGATVLVWAKIIVNPQLSGPLEDISVLIHLPFPPRTEGNVTSEPQATWNADRRILEWDLPTSMIGGEKKVLQARLAVEEAKVRVETMPPIAPAMVTCQLSDTTFSSIEFTASGTNMLGGDEVTGEVVKRCRMQCKQY